MDPQPAPTPAAPAGPRQEIIDHLRTANNVLVTVSNNPSVDQLAACLGLTLLLNKMGKHATAVFSGGVPSTIEFLKPEETLERNTDSLRDFIIALDKSKADKLRYKVEDKLVRIYITPYHTAITDKDLEFSQGDFNVDMVIALGVQRKDEIDQAITAHGRILHDAAVVTINTRNSSDLGAVNWQDSKASSLCEMVTSLAESLKPELIDTQIATALMTGIVAETKRFSNDLTTSVTMSLSARLMSAGANQQLVASELKETGEVALALKDEKITKSDQKDTLVSAKASTPKLKPTVEAKDIDEQSEKPEGDKRVDDSKDDKPKPDDDLPKLKDVKSDSGDEDKASKPEEIHIDEHGVLSPPAVAPKLPKLDELPSLKPEPKVEQPLDITSPSLPQSPQTDNLPSLTPFNPPSINTTAPVISEDLKPVPPTIGNLPPSSPPTSSPFVSIDTPASNLPPVFGSHNSPIASDENLTQLEKDVDSPHADLPKLDEPKPDGIPATDDMLAKAREAIDQLADDSKLPSFDALTPPTGEQVPITPIDTTPPAMPNPVPLPDNLVPKTPPIDDSASPLASPAPPPPVPPPLEPFKTD